MEHLGYVQIDTINVIERCHHHILYTRIPEYRREHLRQAQSADKTVFEYWTHALSFVPTRDMRHYVRDMRRYRRRGHVWFAAVKENDVRRVLARIRKHGALTIRDIDDDVLVEKDHAWASRKPSKRALQLAFYKGLVTISQRAGMLKTYELMNRHFGWAQLPPAAPDAGNARLPAGSCAALAGRRERGIGVLSRCAAQARDAPPDRIAVCGAVSSSRWR